MKLCKMAVVVGLTLGILVPAVGCGSGSVSDKEPRLTSPGDPKLKGPVGRGAGGKAGKEGGTTGGGVNKP